MNNVDVMNDRSSIKESRLYAFFFRFAKAIIVLNVTFLSIELVYAFVFTRLAFPYLPLTYTWQFLIYAAAFIVAGAWLVRYIKNPYIVWVYIGLIIVYAVLRNDHSLASSLTKYWFRWIFPVDTLRDASPSFLYLEEHAFDDGIRLEFFQIFVNYPFASIWGLVTSGLLYLVLVITFVVQIFSLVRLISLNIKQKVRGYKLLERSAFFMQTHLHGQRGLRQFFHKREIALMLFPLIALSVVDLANLHGFGRTIQVTPGTSQISLSLYEMPQELAKAMMNKTWIENTTEGQQFMMQLGRYNFTVYTHISPADISTPSGCENWTKYIEYLWSYNVRVSIDGWCNIKYYYASWLPMFKAIVNFRTNSTYKSRLTGLAGVSGDFESDHPTGLNVSLYNDVKQNVTGEIAWMRQQLADAGLGRADFKFGSISGVYMDGIDGDDDISMLHEGWFPLDYDFDAPMFYKDGIWISQLNLYFTLQNWTLPRICHNAEKRVLLGITGRARYQARFGIEAIVKEINLARSWGVVDVGFFLGPTSSDFQGLFDVFVGAQGMLNGSHVNINRSNLLDVLMQAVYKNETFTIEERSLPEILPEDQLGTTANNMATEFRDNSNLDFMNLLNPFGELYNDLFYNLDHGFSFSSVAAIIAIVAVVVFLAFKQITRLIVSAVKKLMKARKEPYKSFPS